MDAKDEVKQRLSVEEVIGDYLELKRAGSNLKAVSPFTNEKTASFMVSPQKQIWHDFSSNKGGDIFSFVMEMEGVDFKEALKILAKKAGVELKQMRGDGKLAKKKQAMQEAVASSVDFYQKMLVKNQTALKYVVEERGYKRKVITDFGLGYSPKSGQDLIQHLTKKGINRRTIEEAGLAVKRSGKLVDMFRNRMMVPLRDSQGNPIGFTARVLDDSLPKYINTPQTLLYDKSRHLFGFSLAKEQIRQKGYVIVVEGNLDVIASHKAGVGNVVASAGTSLTKQHLQMLARFTDDIRLAFDQDSAGLRATERTIPIAQSLGLNLSIISIENGKDPDDLIKKDPQAWQELVEKKIYSIDWLIDVYEQKLDLNKVNDKKSYTDTVLKTLSRVSDPVEIDHYLGVVAKKINSSKSSLREKLASINPDRKRLKKNRAKKVEKVSKNSDHLDYLLGLNLLYPDVRQTLDRINLEQFNDSAKRIVDYLQDNPNKIVTKTPKSLHDIDDYVKIVLFKTEELYGDWSSSDLMIEAIGLSRRLTQESQNRLKQEITQKIKDAEVSGNEELRQRYLKKFNDLLKKES